MDALPSEVLARRSSFLEMREGDTDPRLGKTIDTLIVRTERFVVYLDEDLYVEWLTDLSGSENNGDGAVFNRVSWLETKPIGMLRKDQQRTFRRMLGEGVARMLGGRVSEAHSILDQAEQWITARSQEAARKWLLLGSVVPAVPFAFLAVIIWSFRDSAYLRWGSAATDVAMSACLGALGALLSIIWRTGTQQWEPEAGAQLHYYEAFARIIAGVLGAAIVWLALRADLVGGLFAKSGHSVAFLLAIVAGFSERLVPGFVSRVETSFSRDAEKTLQRTTRETRTARATTIVDRRSRISVRK